MKSAFELSNNEWLVRNGGKTENKQKKVVEKC